MQERVDHRLDQPAALCCCWMDVSVGPHSAPQCSAMVYFSLKKCSERKKDEFIIFLTYAFLSKARYVKDLVLESDALLRYLIGKTKKVISENSDLMSTFLYNLQVI